MKKTLILISLAAFSLVGTAVAQHDNSRNHVKHVLLISVDGMHAVDFLNCANGISTVNNGRPFCPALAALANHGVNYVAASTSKPSDSFPGLTAIVTGGSPAFTGVYYDVAYSRNLDGPKVMTGNGNGPGPCTGGAAPTGFTTEYEEGIDIDQTKVNGGTPGASLTDGTTASIDPNKLPQDPARGCAPVFPWQFVRANSIFTVVHQQGGVAAWSDKHPAYASVSAPIGPAALDDFYSPEINSNVVGLPGVTTPTGVHCDSVLDPASDTSAWTNSFQNIQCYDTLKVDAVLNWIDGKTHLGGGRLRETPNIFGMNFQALSVGQKLNEKAIGVQGGYLDAAGTPSDALLGEFRFVDASIAEFVNELKARGLFDSTLIVITAKHGQSPIDPTRYVPQLKAGTSPATLLSNAGLIPFSESTNNPTGIGPTEDDVSLIWLNDQSKTLDAVGMLEANADATTGIALGQIFYGPALSLNYNDPAVDPRTPDIIITPNVGVTYTGSTKKQEEHGGFAHDDTNVVLLLSNPRFHAETVRAAVGTAQVAPTILEALGIDSRKLDAVRAEGTAALPAAQFKEHERF
ncbi:MAG TPA: alkaline phosphatase family protein [Candidatus Sulfotelmatobacter sp.]|nr:alkaline phosphatase family protein [Candidatus Sulfotelmatobacter sp.]